MENAGIPETQMALMLCISLPRLRQLKRSSSYLKARVKITLGLIVDHDLMLQETREQRREMLTQLLPPALQVIANAVQRPPTCFAETKLQVEVAQDILDREGTYAKISRSEIKPVEHFDWESVDGVAKQIIHLVRNTSGSEAARPPLGPPYAGAESPASQSEPSAISIRAARLIEITRQFSASGVITAEEQQTALRTIDTDSV